MIIFYGDQDKVVPPSQNEVVHKRYQEAGLESSLHLIKGAGHGGLQFSDQKRYGLIKAFVDRHIKQIKQQIKLEESKPPESANSEEVAGEAEQRRHCEGGMRVPAIFWRPGITDLHTRDTPADLRVKCRTT